jgi:hypothetical protein
MKLSIAITIAAVLATLSPSRAGPAQPANPPTPTTRILAIGTINPGVDSATVRSILPSEVRETVKLYLDGTIDQWFSLQGRNGVAFILNVTDPAAAHDMLQKLPPGAPDELRTHPACSAQSASATAGRHPESSLRSTRHADRARPKSSRWQAAKSGRLATDGGPLTGVRLGCKSPKHPRRCCTSVLEGRHRPRVAPVRSGAAELYAATRTST